MKSKNLIEESIKLQLEAKAIGLDWIELDKIIDKIREETDELDEAIESKIESMSLRNLEIFSFQLFLYHGIWILIWMI